MTPKPKNHKPESSYTPIALYTEIFGRQQHMLALTTHSSSKVSLVSLTAHTFTCKVLEGSLRGATGKENVSPKMGRSVLLSRWVQHVKVAVPAGKSCTLMHLWGGYRSLVSVYDACDCWEEVQARWGGGRGKTCWGVVWVGRETCWGVRMLHQVCGEAI